MQAVADGRLLWCRTPQVAYLTPTVMQAHAWLRCAFTTRRTASAPGSFNLSYDRGPHHVVSRRREALLKTLGLEGATLHTVRQVHGNRVCIVDSPAPQNGLAGVEADALVTALPNTALGVLVADCLPIVLYALHTPIAAVVHAGRMGTFHLVARAVLGLIRRQSGVEPAQLHALLGPAIGACCYDLDDRAVRPFQERFPDWELFIKADERNNPARPWTMSLTAANKSQLLAEGIPSAQIETVSPCTQCHREHFYSHRAEGPAARRGMAVIGIRNNGAPPPAR
jgi:YfiH family protein